MNRKSKKNVAQPQTKLSESEYDEMVKSLWKKIQEAPSDQLENLINQLDEDMINKIRTLNNPYKKPILDGDKNKYLAFNFINIRHKYLQRLNMTSLIGFIYKMLDEYETESDYISENDPEFSNLYNQKLTELAIKKTREQLESDTSLLYKFDISILNDKIEEKTNKIKVLTNSIKITEQEINELLHTKTDDKIMESIKGDLEKEKQFKQHLETRMQRREKLIHNNEIKINEKSELETEIKKLELEKSIKEKYYKLNPTNKQIEKYTPSSEDCDMAAEEIKKQLNISKTHEEYEDDVKQIIETFLNKYFRYDPNEHVRSCYKPNYSKEKPKNMPVPPEDTFHRWNRYMENNYEYLRQVTDDIYAEKSDFEVDIVPLETFEGPTALDDFDKYKRKYSNEFESDVYLAKFMNHNLLDSWQENRDKRDFYNRNTEIIKRIIDQNNEDSKIGQNLMKQRAKKEKKKNIKKLGPDPKSFELYKKSNPNVLDKHGARHIDNLNEIQVPIDLQESTNQEVEVGVHVIKPIRGRRIRGFTNQWKFNIPAEELKEGQVTVKNAAEIYKN